MKVLQINTRYKYGGSTGRIAYDLQQIAAERGIDAYVAYGYDFDKVNAAQTLCMEGTMELTISKLQSRIFARHGFYNRAATHRLIRYMDEIRPDAIHLHNLHNHYLHCGMLFRYIKEHDIPVVWTLHDCWSFTGWCAYFDYAQCDRWRTHCYGCPCKRDYPYAWFSARAKSNFDLKRRTFCGVKRLLLVTPSQWLADLTRESFLRDYPVAVINNGVDTEIFRPCGNGAKGRLGLDGKRVLLAMASGFGVRKGGEYLKRLPSLLHEDEALLLVGRGASSLAVAHPERVVGIEYTNDVQELAEYYSAADVFINPTLEDNFPTTNIEALACGTPIVTFDTGGSVEAVSDCVFNGSAQTSVGVVVPQGDLESMLSEARRICTQGKSSFVEVCRNKALRDYNKVAQYEQYVKLYNEVYESKDIHHHYML